MYFHGKYSILITPQPIISKVTLLHILSVNGLEQEYWSIWQLREVVLCNEANNSSYFLL